MKYKVEECGDIDIFCSSCHQQLGVVVVTQPTAKIKNKIIFKCPFCNDQSFRKEIDGVVYISGTDKVKIINMDTNIIEEPNMTMIQELTIFTGK
jgi:RNA polymerase subunit RPABC4/transcription elongation factor Spt4